VSEELLSVKDVAERLGVSAEAVRRWMRRGELPYIDLGGPAGYRIRLVDLEQFLEDRTRRGKTAGEWAPA
jgi:excisionase family DNA binding protein